MTETAFKGSEWNKWDLHLHTPFTKLSDNFKAIGSDEIWKTYCDKIESSDVVCFGITDYFSCDNYYTFLENHKTHYPQSEKVFFLNIEFRLEVGVNKAGEEVNIHIIFSDKVVRSKVEEFLTLIETNITRSEARVACKNMQQDDFVSAGIRYDQLRPTLSKIFGKDNCYFILAASNNAGLRADSNSPRKLNITDEIDKVCHGFFGGQQNVQYYLNPDRYESSEIADKKPVLSGSDAHSFEDIQNFVGKRLLRIEGEKTIIEKDITWIKAEKTFEGLRQIFHEPEFRISIGELHPREPIRKIEKIKFNFPDKCKIKKQDSKEYQDLCIKKIKKEIRFSPYFTCLIGGRGTGKSTIINLIAERLRNATDFFSSQQNSLYLDQQENTKYDLRLDKENYIEIIGTNDIEFVSQGKVEKLTEGDALTNLIFQERIFQVDIKLQNLQEKLNIIIDLIDKQIEYLRLVKMYQEVIAEKEIEETGYTNIISSISDPIYEETTRKIKDITDGIYAIENSQEKYTGFLDRLKKLVAETPLSSNDNEYEKRVQVIIESILELPELKNEESDISVTPYIYTETDQKLTLLKETLEKAKEELTSFFAKKGTSQESVQDSQAANEKLSKIQQEIITLREKNTQLQNRILENQITISGIIALDSSIKEIIETNIKELNKKLLREKEDVAAISYKYEFDDTKYKTNLFSEFNEVFKHYHISGTSWDSVREVVFLIKPDTTLLEMSHSQFLDLLDEKISSGSNRNTNYVSIVLNIFKEEYNFEVYKNIVYKHLFNVFENVSIKGWYGKRELKNCSFGQKCTAVIVTLLMTGVKPLIIDEPEAHLDNRLIADYLVDLIKEKKSDRQIIFATHNANFVINGDADLIYILEVPEEDNFTIYTPTTIENVSYRDKLLKLEGGKMAFEKRERKLMLT